MLEKRRVLLENIGIVSLITFVSLQTIFVASRKCFVRLLNEDNRCIDISNARQDIRHLRIRCDAERLASMGRAEPEDWRSTLRSDRQTSGISSSLRSTIQYRCRDLSLSPFLSESQKTRPFHPPQLRRGHNRLRYQSAARTSSLKSRNIT